jgi:hypothetical protein
MGAVDTYLNQIRYNLHLDPNTESSVIGELETYFQDKIEDLQTEGLTEADAARQAINSFGTPRKVARLLYEAHSRGSWLEALLAAQPALLGAGLFATHLWSQPLVLIPVFSLLLVVTLLGWLRGKPNWLYPWIGFAFAPVLAVVFLSRTFVYGSVYNIVIGSGVSAEHVALLLFLGLYGVAFWIVLAVVSRILKQDWLLVSYMLLPLPLLGIWIAAIDGVGQVLFTVGLRVHQWDRSMVLALLLLGLSALVFTRLRPRLSKLAALLMIGMGSTAIAGWSMMGANNFFNLLLMSAIPISTVLVPAALQSLFVHPSQTAER